MANTTSLIDNVKLAVVLEVILRIMMERGLLVWSRELEEAVEKGIEARRRQGRTNKAGHSREENLLAWKGADMRLRLLVKMSRARIEKAKMAAGNAI